MYGKLLFIAGLGVGYVVGTSRGRKEYEKLRMRASQIWLDPRVQKAARQATDAVERNVPMGEKVTEAVDAATASARSPRRTIRHRRVVRPGQAVGLRRRFVTDPALARRWIDDRRQAVRERLAEAEARLTEVRVARGDWSDEEHDPEGFALTFEWQHAEGARAQQLAELRDLDEAEARVAAGRYGVCFRCAEPMPEAQLELRPARTTCVACTDARR